MSANRNRSSRWESRMGTNALPSVFVIGAMKSGTTSVVDAVTAIEGISCGRIKEPWLFETGRGPMLTSLRVAFNYGIGPGLRLEGTTEYSKFSSSARYAELLADRVPHAKIVYVVRDPVDRAISHVRHDYERGRLDSALSLTGHLQGKPDYIDNSRYQAILAPWYESFGRQVFVTRNDRLFASGAEQHDLLAFIGLETSGTLTFSSLNQSGSARDLRRAHAAAGLPLYRGFIRPLIPSSLRSRAASALSRGSEESWVSRYGAEEERASDWLESELADELEWFSEISRLEAS